MLHTLVVSAWLRLAENGNPQAEFDHLNWPTLIV